MMFWTCVRRGTGAGLAMGVVASAYFGGVFERADREANPAIAPIAGSLSVTSIVAAPVFGAGAGVGYYFFKSAPPQTKAALAVVTGVAVAATAAYELASGQLR